MSDVARLRTCTPVIPVQDIQESLAFHQEKLGFTKLFDDAQRQTDGITADRPWGSREFEVHDPNRAALVFFETIAL